MLLYERELDIPSVRGHRNLLGHLARAVASRLAKEEAPVRFAIVRTEPDRYCAELGVLRTEGPGRQRLPDIFELRKRVGENVEKFNVALLVPTGINAEVGGHAGDAGAVARLLASVADTLVTHPNVVNGSDINELPDNGLYVEGSIISRLLMGTVGLERARANRVLLVIDEHQEATHTNAAINALNAARACYGLSSPRIVKLEPGVKLESMYTSSGRAAGRVDGLEGVIEVLDRYRSEYDAVAFSSVIEVPLGFHLSYFQSAGDMVNPWGGVEAIFTHAISLLYGIPSAHSPMLESVEIEVQDPGVVDPRMAAEAVSLTFLQCVLKGLQRSPRIVLDRAAMSQAGVLTARDISALVIPDGCLGLPTLAALEQGIPVVAVRGNRNLMRNDPAALPWARDQYVVVENYLEAAGALAAMKAGLALDSVRRPIEPAQVTSIENAIDPRRVASR